MVKQVGAIPFEVPGQLPQIVDTTKIDQGGVFTWAFQANLAGIPGNSQSTSPFFGFTVPFPVRLLNLKFFLARFSNTGVYYDTNKFQITIFPVGPPSPIINAAINSAIGPGVPITNQVSLYGDSFRGPSSFDVNLDLKPNINYEIDNVLFEVVAAGDQINSYTLLTLKRS